MKTGPVPSAYRGEGAGATRSRSADLRAIRCEGALCRRIAPWGRVEVIHELPDTFDYEKAQLVMDGKAGVTLTDGRCSCPIVTAVTRRS